MKVYNYNYNKDTKEYISTTQASENPLEKGKYLIPANATTIEIGTNKDGSVQVFDETNQKWDYIEDNRGKTVYDTTTKRESKVDYLGTIKSGFTELVPSEFDVWNGSSWEVDLKSLSRYNEQLAKEAKTKALDELVITHNTVAYDANGRAIGNMSAVMGVANFKYNQAIALGTPAVDAYQLIYKDTKIWWKGADNQPHEVMIESVCEALEKSMTEVAVILGL